MRFARLLFADQRDLVPVLASVGTQQAFEPSASGRQVSAWSASRACARQAPAPRTSRHGFPLAFFGAGRFEVRVGRNAEVAQPDHHRYRPRRPNLGAEASATAPFFPAALRRRISCCMTPLATAKLQHA